MQICGTPNREGLKHRTIKAYLSSIRCVQIHNGMGNPFISGSMPRPEYVLGRIKRMDASLGRQTCTTLPITPDILMKLRDIWLAPLVQHDTLMLWAVACIGLLRAGEFTVPSPEAYDPEVHLNLGDLALDSHTHPTLEQDS